MILPLARSPRPTPPRPQDVEQTVVRSHPLLAGARVAAFTVDSRWTTKFVVVAEAPRRLQRLWELDLTGESSPLVEEVQTAVRNAVARRHRLHVDAVMVVPRRTIPLDENGAVAYAACRRAFAENAFMRLDGGSC